MASNAPHSDAHKALSDYTSVLEMRSKPTQKMFRCVMNNIRAFGKIDVEDISSYGEDDVYPLLQEWIAWNAGRGIAPSSIRCYFNTFRSYLWYHKIRLDDRDVQQNLKFPRLLHEIRTPVTPAGLRRILAVSKPGFRFQLLALVSSGMRVGELGQIRITHLDLTRQNVTVRIPAQITKTGRSRITFFSRQVSDMIRYRIRTEKIHNGGRVFGDDKTCEQFVNLVIKRFAAARRSTGMLEKYSHCKQNRYSIHVHALRSYFITKANQLQFGLGHILAGHEFYMKEYNRHTEDELLGMYKQLETQLTFHKTYYDKSAG